MTEKTKEKNPAMEIDLKKLFRIYLRRWWVIVLCAVLVGTAGWYVTREFVTPMYRASVTVYVNSVRADQQINTISSSSLATAQRLVSTYVNIIKSDTVLEKVSEAMDEEFSMNTIRSVLSASQIGETELFDVHITHADPEAAARIANAVAEVAPGEIEKIVEGSSAKIVDYAKVPTAPASPNVMRNTLIFAFVGGLLSVLFFTVRFLMDVRIKDEEDLTNLFDIPVLGRIPPFDEDGGQKYVGYEKAGYVKHQTTAPKKGVGVQ